MTNHVASNITELNADIALANASGTADTITLSAGFTLSADIAPINLSPGGTLVIDGAGFTISGGDTFHGFFVATGTVNIGNLTLSHTRAQGGSAPAGYYTGGGGAGLGGGLFVGGAGTVSLSGVTFADTSAHGGRGGDYLAFSNNTAGGGLGGHGSLPGYGGGAAAPGHISTGGGTGGFGGGGGGGGGSGGFGGGAGGGNSSGGFGGGGNVPYGGGGGGGGLGAGGAIFVRHGGALTIGAGDISGATVAGGSGSNYGGMSGSAFGAGLFIQGNQTVTLAPASDETLTIANAIADQTGSGGTAGNAGIGALALTGGGRVALTAASSFTGGISIGNGSTLSLGATGAAGTGHIRFAAGATLAIAAGIMVANTLDTIQASNVIDVGGITGATAVINGSTLTISGTGGSVTLKLDSGAYQQAFAADDDGNGGTAVTYTACYAAGTRIAIPSGEVPVETLRAGDTVCLAGGGVAGVRWMGHRRVDCARHPRPHDVAPVRVQAGAFGPGLPRRDLILSPDHAVFVDGALIPIRYLLNGATIAQEPAGAIEYWHVELPRHGVILAEGLPAESYLDTGNRAAFANGGTTAMAHPDFALRVWEAESCAPLVTAGTLLAAVAARLLARAETLGHTLTDDPAPLLRLGRHTLRPRRHAGGWRWLLPARAADAVLLSRLFVPAELDPGNPDRRPLGIPVARVLLDDAELDLARLGAGWHSAEPGLRWTDGAAAIPLSRARSLTVVPAMAVRYWGKAA